MAGILDALASYVTRMLADMAREEVAMLIGVSGEIDDLAVKLRDLKNFLADADRRNITDESVQGWVEELKRAMYHATDILDLCQLKVMEQDPSKNMGCLNPLLFCMRNPLHAQDIGSRIKALNQRLDDICKRGGSFNFIKLEAYHQRKMKMPPSDRKTYPLLERSGVVGEKIEDDTRELVKILTKQVAAESDCIMVVAIVGVGGIGKTTLAKKIFNDSTIQRKFAKMIWLSIAQEFTEIDLLRTAITSANGNMPICTDGVQDKALLVPALAAAIKDKMFFLVLDDMWGSNEWDNLLKVPFSHGAPGSRVLLTTRHEMVARGMKAVHPYHHVNKLGLEDGWSLLKKQVLSTEKSEPAIDMLKDIGLHIIEKCDGLPLAIKVMGGLLCRREKERRDWEKIMNDSIWSVSQMPEELNYAMYLSYEDLHPCLKQCFLHFSLKPKRKKIGMNRIITMWIGEGFIHGNSDGLEELGEDYYRELILRNLIEPDTDYFGQYVSHMHDVVRSFAQFVARHEALVAHNGEIDNGRLATHRFLRLSIENKGLESNEFKWRSLQEQELLRTLMLFGDFKIQSDDSLITFSSLRTLHIESKKIAGLVESIYQLKHMRYLAVENCNDINSLPEKIHKMRFLQHISLKGCENLMNLPDSIVKLRELRCLNLVGTCVNSMPRGFHALTNLRTLCGFRANIDSYGCSLEELGPLSRLKRIELVGLENVTAASFATKAKLGEKGCLSLMSLFCGTRLSGDGLAEGVPKEDQRIIEEVFDELYPPPCIEDIRIKGYFGRQLPRWMMSIATTSLNSLKILRMKDLACCGQLPDGLCQLPYLEYLDINHAPAIKRVGSEFIQPYNHSHHASSQVSGVFPRLHDMRLLGMVEWEEWEWKENMQAMPVLENLLLRSCKLSCIPPGLASHARALKKLNIWSVHRLHSLENFCSVVELDLCDNPVLTSISNFPRLQKLKIHNCQNLESLQEMNALRKLELTAFYNGKQLPVYLQTVKPSHLKLDCSSELLASMAAGKSGPEWNMFSHIQQVEAYAKVGDDEKKWHLLYTREPCKIETNLWGQ